MSLRLVGWLAIAGCSSPATPPAVRPPIAPPITPIVEPIVVPDLTAIFAVPAVPTTHTRCRSFPKPPKASSNGRTIIYDFAEMPLGAIESGARAGTRERRIDPMTANELHRPFARRANHITRCWKWFAATHPGGDTHLDVHLAIDAFGATGTINIVNNPEDADLAACIRDAFVAPLYVVSPHTHEQQTTVTIEFDRADQPAWKKPPVRPKPITTEPLPERGDSCLQVLPGVVSARLYPLHVTDFDTARIPPPPPAPKGMRSHVAPMPALRIPCATVVRSPRKSALRAAVRSNWGAYEACHAEARARVPDLAGKIEAKLVFDGRGEHPVATVSGAGDDAFHACVEGALAAIWLDPPTDGVIIANFTFPLVTDPPPAIGDEAAWRAKLSKRMTPDEGCEARRALIDERLLVAPWVDDARVRAAFAELAAYIAKQAEPDAKRCLAAASQTLHDYAGVDTHTLSGDAEDLQARLDRLEVLRPLATIADWGPNLMWMIALAYRRDPAHVEEGNQILEALALDPKINDVVHVEEPARPIENACAL